MTEEAKGTVELLEPESKQTETPPAAPTRDELKAKGWTAKELDSAEKRGMVKPKEEKPPVLPIDKKEPEPPKAETPPAPTPPVPEPKKRSSLPEFNLSPEQEKVFVDSFGPGTEPRALYFRMKNERQARQQAQENLQKLTAELESTKARLHALEAGKPPAEGEEDFLNKPLTIASFLEIEKQKKEASDKAQRELDTRAQSVATAQKAQEEYVKTLVPDFDETVTRAKEVMQDIEALVPEKWRQAKLIRLIQDLQTTAANADKIGLDDYNAAMIAYEIGTFHPDHGKKADANGTQPRPEGKPANGSLTPEQMKRIEENTQRRASSASVSGTPGRRQVSASEVTVKDFLSMSHAQREDFRRKYPEHYDKLRRG